MMPYEDFLKHLSVVKQNIAQKASQSGRNPQDITLVAATKTKKKDEIVFAIKNGIKVCGENRVQEFLEKLKQNTYEGAEVHFIGHLQKNKVKDIVGKVSLIQSVDSLALAEEINKRAASIGIIQNVLLEVNIASEKTKIGFSVFELYENLEEISKLRSIKVRGIMTIPPKIGENETNIVNFLKMYNLFLDISREKYDNIYMEFLSMGMSDDYGEAILAGSNMIRIGSELFGDRK